MVAFGAKSRDNDRAGLSLRLRKTGFYNIDGSVTLQSESLRRIKTREKLLERTLAEQDGIRISGSINDQLEISGTDDIGLGISR